MRNLKWLGPLIAWSPALALAVALLAAPALTLALHRASPPGEYVEASGYGAVVSGLLAPRGWLVGYVDESSDVTPTHVVAIDASAPPQILGFYGHSYLAEDIRANNPALWLFSDGRLVGSDPSAHRLPRPFNDERSWRGDLTFAVGGQSSPVLEGDDGAELTLEAPPPYAPDMPPPTAQTVDLSAAGHPPAANMINLTYRGQAVASFQVVGQQVVVKAQASPDVTLLVAGQVVSPRAEGAAYRALAPGQVVLFRTAQGERTFRLVGKGGALSAYLPFATPNRTFASELDTLSHPLVDSLNNWMADDPSVADGLERLPVATTLDEPLNAAVQAALDDQVKKLGQQVNDTGFRAAATVIDAQTGDILALGTSSGDTGAALNQNFVRLPIGSAAKIPFSAAILNWRPEMASLTIDSAGAPTFSTLLGVDLCSPAACDAALRAKRVFHEEAVGLGHVNFCTFIEHSSNKYGTSLLLLASAPNPETPGVIDAKETYSLAGTAHKTLPPLMFPVAGNDAGGTLLGAPPVLSARLGWIGGMSDMFDLPLVERTSSGGQDQGDLGDYDLSVWSALIGDHKLGLTGFKQVSPEQESFALNTVADLRNDYLTLILGGGRSRWTTVKLAEVFARIVMNRRIHATLYDPKGLVADSRPVMRPEARALLVQALQTTTSGGGTARLLASALTALQAQAAQGEEVRIYAKTGTPTILEVRRSPANEAIDFLIHQGKVVATRDGHLVVAGADATHDPARLLAADRAIVARLTGLGASPEAVVRSLGQQAVYARRTLSQGLTGLDPDISWTHDGGVFAFVIGRYRVGAPAEQPERAYAVAINVQQRVQNGTNPALLITQALLQGALGHALMAGVPAQTPRAAPWKPGVCPGEGGA